MKKLCMILLAALLLLSAACASPAPQETAAPKDVSVVTEEPEPMATDAPAPEASASDVILIFNTFSGTTKYSLRITNIFLYYLGQLLIAYSLFL